MGEKGRKGRKIGKKDEKDEKRVISVPRSFARPIPDGKLKKSSYIYKYVLFSEITKHFVIQDFIVISNLFK